MIGFGDSTDPVAQSIDLIEDLLIDFINQWTNEAQIISQYAKPKTSGESLFEMILLIT